MKFSLALVLLLANAACTAAIDATPPKCEDFISLFEGATCQLNSAFSPTQGGKWFILMVGYEKKEYYQILAKDVSDPKVKKAAENGIEIMKQFKNKYFVPDIKKVEYFGDWLLILVKNINILNFSALNVGYSSEVNWIRQFIAELEILLSIIRQISGKRLVIGDLKKEELYSKSLVGKGFENKLMILDFESAAKVGDPIDDRGDFRYWEPGRFDGREKVFTEEVDSYAMAVIMYRQLHAGSFPYTGQTREEYAAAVAKGEYNIDVKVPPELAAILILMLNSDRTRRPSLDELTHIFSELSKKTEYNTISKSFTVKNTAAVPAEILSQISPKTGQVLLKYAAKYSVTNDGNDPSEADADSTHYGFWIAGGLVILILAAVVIYVLRSKNPDAPAEANPENIIPVETTGIPLQETNK